jgi:ABC-2 type transport system permease protein
MKNSLTGWKDVYSFTLKQTLKNKAFIISFVILLILCLASMPLISTLTSNINQDGDENNTLNPIKKVYVDNKTTMNIDFSTLINDQSLGHITFETLEDDDETITNRIETWEKSSIIFTLNEEAGVYQFSFVKSTKGPINHDHLTQLSMRLTEAFQIYLIESMEISDEQLDLIQANIQTKTTILNTDGFVIPKEDTSITVSAYWFIYGLLFIVLMVNIFASTQIATAIVTEKSTRVIEYLLTSVKPLAIMVGKILAMLTAVLLQISTMGIVLFLSNKVTSLFFKQQDSVISQYLPDTIFENLNLLNIILAVLTVLLGLIFYSTLAGLTGATVSKIEELSEGMVFFTFTNLIGVYIGIAAAGVLMGAGMNGFVIFTFLFPLSSPFILPGAILVGRTNAFLIGGAILLQIGFVVLLFLFVARVYETLILHNGNKIKVKDLFKIAKLNKKEGNYDQSI